MADLGRLGAIVEAKRHELAARLGATPIDDLRANARPTSRRLRAAMDRPGGRFIFEFKRASPSEGALARDASPAAVAGAYSGVADAMSVLVDPHFLGSLDDLVAARARFDGPILAKDFVIDPRQVVEARIHGADAVLAILAVLDDGAARAVIDEAARHGMDVLIEVHDEAEMRRALALDAPLIGINNRDLTTFRTDLATSERLAPMAVGRTVIAESGIATRADIERLAPHVDGFLIGSTPMRSGDPRRESRALAFGRVKLCGLRTPQDLPAAAPAAYAGLVFAPSSPRAITLHEAKRLAAGSPVPPLVAVIQDQLLLQALDIVRELPLAAVQLHGSEDSDYVARLRDAFDGEIWLAERPGVGPRGGGDRTLYDSGSGSGAPFDWASVKGRDGFERAILAGGIGAHNARGALATGAFAIDIGSAMDAAPGVKDHGRIAALFEALRPVSRKERVLECA
jgi:indole-3-glycerol phosphate synthase/phosphoribosylanthranilate isomerase